MSSPISMATIETMANQIGSYPSFTATGCMMGIVRRMIETESMMQPSIRNTTMKAAITTAGHGERGGPPLAVRADPRW